MKHYKKTIISILDQANLEFKPDYNQLDTLSGGVVSLILSTTNLDNNHDHQNLVIKHTLEDIKMQNGPFAGRDQHTLLNIAPHTHELDYLILKLLQNSNKVNVPHVIWGDPNKRMTIMRDFRHDGYSLVQDLLVKGQLTQKSASTIGKTLAYLVQEMKVINSQIEPVENAELQAEERLDELLTFLRPNIDLFRSIKKKFLTGKHIIPTDGHPKNLAINNKDEVMVFDFGRSIIADPQYVAPNFAAHIGLAIIGNCFDSIQFGIKYLYNFINNYNKHSDKSYQIEEMWFVRYFVAELLHRGLSGRWIDKRIFQKISLQQMERAIHDICIEVFRPEKAEPIMTIKSLFELLEDTALMVKKGKYKYRR